MVLEDQLKVLRGKDIEIDQFITLKQPRLSDIVDFGEQRFFSTFYTLCSIPSDMKSALWDANLDFMKVTDWQLFLMLSRNFGKEDTSLIFGDIDFAAMSMMKVPETGEVVLTNGMQYITEASYSTFIPYVREMVGYVMKREKAGNKFTKMILIEEDRQKRELNANKPYESSLFPIIVSLVNTEEFSYKYEDVFDITLYQLMKSYMQIQNKKSAMALYQGSMSGFVDTSKINRKDFSWVYDESKFQS